MANRDANTASAIARLPGFWRLRSVRVQNGTTAMVRPATGKSRQRGSKTRPRALSRAVTVVAMSVNPRIILEGDRVLLCRGPISSRNVGRVRPYMYALEHRSGAVIARIN